MASSAAEPTVALGGTIAAMATACLAACGGSGATAASVDGGSGAGAPQIEAEAGARAADGGATDASVDEAGEGADGASPSAATGVHLFFSDLLSGPATGGQDGEGAFVTVWGNGFGATRGTSTVTVGGGAVASYPVWTPTKITFQLGAVARTGSIVVHVAASGDSRGLPFTVRPGGVFFVTATGDDANPGTFASPWKTIAHAKDTLAGGDIAYLGARAGDEVSQIGTYRYGASLSMDLDDGSNSGTAAMPKALVVYPGATATVGQESGVERGLLVPAITGTFDSWVISGLTLRGQNEALDFEGTADGWRVVGCDVSCPNGTGQSGCIVGGDGTSPHALALLGNVVHDVAANVTMTTKYYHGIYLASNGLELGWNEVRDGKTCRAIQFHDSTGPNLYDIRVHDNLVHGTICDGINFATVDPSQGAVEAYNNVVYDVGLGPDPSDGSSDYACIYVANITNAGAPGSGNVHVYDNTLFNCGARGTSAAGALARGAGPVGIQADDNLVVATSGESYFSGDATIVLGSDNLFFGGGGVLPGGLTGTVTGDPRLAAPANHDFHLLPGSAAIDHGIPTAAAVDYEGNARPQGLAFDIGAYERPE